MQRSSFFAIASLAFGVLAATASASCFDPVHSRAVEELGEEKPGVPEGPLHRPGQPCTTCHGGDGPADAEYAFAGTIYAVRNGATPLAGVTVTLTDSNGVTKTVSSNEAGNFFLEKERWESVKLPVFVALTYGEKVKTMKTRIGRNGGCAFCHYSNVLDDPTKGDNDRTHMPPVYLEELPP